VIEFAHVPAQNPPALLAALACGLIRDLWELRKKNDSVALRTEGVPSGK